MAIYLVDQQLTGQDLNRLSLIAYKPASQQVDNTIDMVDATGLALNLAPNARYALDGYIAYDTNETPDIKLIFYAPRAATGHWGIYPIVQGSTGGSGDVEGFRLDNFNGTDAVGAGGYATGTGPMWCMPHGYIATTYAGTLRLAYSQVTATMSGTTIQAGSWLRATRLA